jgi:hypothetical protein
LFLIFLLVVGCSEEEVSQPAIDESFELAKEDVVSNKEVLLPDESLFAEQQKRAKDLGIQHRFEVTIEGSWVSDGGTAKLKISPTKSKYIFDVEGEFGVNEDHPRSFPLDVRHTFFDFDGKIYRLFFEGRNPSELDLLWWNANENAVDENVGSIRFIRDPSS